MNKTISNHMRKLQRRSARSRWEKLTAAQRSELARKMAAKRWGKAKR